MNDLLTFLAFLILALFAFIALSHVVNTPPDLPFCEYKGITYRTVNCELPQHERLLTDE